MQPINFVKTTTKSNNRVYRFFPLIQHFIYKTVGVSPWILDTSENYQNKEVVSKFSCFGSLYNAFVITLIVLFKCYYVINGSTDNDRTDNDEDKKKDDTVDILDKSQSKSMVSVINRLIIIDRKLNQCTKFEPNRISSYLIFLVNIAISCGTILMVASNSSVKIVISENIPTIISSWVIIQYTLLLIVVEERFKIINSIIYKMGDFASDSTRKPTLLLIDVSILRDSVCQNIDIMMKNAYVELCDICDEITDFFGIPVLISIMYFSQVGIYILYDLMIPSLKKEPNEFAFYSTILIRIVWTVFLFLVLTSSVSRTTSESKKTGKIISLLTDRCPMNPKVKEQMTKFSNDLLHFDVKFSACGIVPLDRSLIGTITGTIATYLVIFIQ
ncbi:GSCOCT00014135001.2-RA-CDS, partial [Cotesia congregata]